MSHPDPKYDPQDVDFCKHGTFRDDPCADCQSDKVDAVYDAYQDGLMTKHL